MVDAAPPPQRRRAAAVPDSGMRRSRHIPALTLLAGVGTLSLLLLLVSAAPPPSPPSAFISSIARRVGAGRGRTALASTPPPRPRPRPRRTLKKRRGRENRRRDGAKYTAPTPASGSGAVDVDDDAPTVEVRPLIRTRSVEAGTDYWIDDADLERSVEEERRRRAARGRAAAGGGEGRISTDRLWEETLAPYRQNWIGYFSVLVVVLAMMVTQFPELLQSPVIPIPDL